MPTLKEMIERGEINHDPRPTPTRVFIREVPPKKRAPKKVKKKRPPRKSALMYRAATKLQQQYRLALKALRTAKGIIEYVPPEVHERSDWLDDQKKLFADRCDDLGVK